jgi:hypothetical protein
MVSLAQRISRTWITWAKAAHSAEEANVVSQLFQRILAIAQMWDVDMVIPSLRQTRERLAQLVL